MLPKINKNETKNKKDKQKWLRENLISRGKFFGDTFLKFVRLISVVFYEKVAWERLFLFQKLNYSRVICCQTCLDIL